MTDDDLALLGAPIERPRTRVLIRWFLLGVVLLGMVGGGYYGYWTHFQRRFRTIVEGEVYQSGAISAGELVKIAREHEIRSVIDLREFTDMPGRVEEEQEALTRAGVRHFHLPSAQLPNPQTVDAFLDIVSKPENLPVLIHCEHGEGRSRLLAAVYRIEFEHWSKEDARRGTQMVRWGTQFAPDRPKGRYLLDYEPRHVEDAPSR